METEREEKKLEPVDPHTLQECGLELLDAFVEICRRKHLRYYLNAGTLLGAVRHQGFIPWDDDVDVCMPRKDYEQFLEAANEMLPSNMRAVCFRNQKPDEHPQYSCQIIHRDIPLIQMISEHPRRTYAWIDVFPLDGMPGNPLLRRIHGLCLLYRRACMQASMLSINVNIRKNRPWHEKAIIWFFRQTGFGRGMDTWKQMEKLDRALCRYDADQSPYWINFMGAYKLKEQFPVQWYGTGSTFSFEGRKLSGPEKADLVLTALYGDYMTPKKPKDSDEGHFLFVDRGEN